jgi:hypothetical protein
VDLARQRVDLLGELCVLVDQLLDQGDSLLRLLLPLHAVLRDVLAMLGVRVGVCLVAIGLPRLGKQDQRRGVGGLQAEGQVEQDERVEIEADETDGVGEDPGANDQRLADQKLRRTEEARERLGLGAELARAERGRQDVELLQEAPVVLRRFQYGCCLHRNPPLTCDRYRGSSGRGLLCSARAPARR